jgi:YjbE family integral membrane protein
VKTVTCGTLLSPSGFKNRNKRVADLIGTSGTEGSRIHSFPSSALFQDYSPAIIDSMHDLFIQEALSALLQVIMIDLTLAGDNAIVIGLAAAGLPRAQRNKAILVGIVAATVLRIIFAGLTIQLLQIIGLLFAGGILLIWVCWKMWRELRLSHRDEENAANALMDQSPYADGPVAASAPRKSFAQAAWQIVIADVSMSLDNVLAIAGAAREHPAVLIFGLTLSIALMGLAASLIARVLQRRRWIAYIGLAVILYVACEMIYRGALEMLPMLSNLKNL